MKIITPVFYSLLALSLICNTGLAQIDGLWGVKRVMVGTEDKTPVARWFRFTAGKQISGNGLLQHSAGTYHYDKKKSEMTFVTDNEPADEFGAFKVARKGNEMTWVRLEEGVKVIVELELIAELPQSTADMIKGLWGLETAVKNSQDITKQYDPGASQFIFIRWDRRYVRQVNASEQVTGYWFMNAHQPELKFISHDHEQEDELWKVSFETEKMVLVGLSENNKDLVLTFHRLKDFPK